MATKDYLIYGVLLSLSGYTWYRFYKEWKKLRDEYEKRALFVLRHNCIVMYKPNSEITGWPSSGTKLKYFSLSDNYEPILHFIRTTEKSLDIAVMVINVQCIVDELLAAIKRNIKIRIITDNTYLRNSAVNQLIDTGIPILCYVIPKADSSSLFHFKYIVKDYSNTGGYLCVGSLNWTVTSVTQNYENLNFISSHHVVEEFYNNFQECWYQISRLNDTNSFVQAKLNSSLIHF